MKIQLLSDLHLEFGEYQYEETDCDVVVLAGDIHTKSRGLEWALDTIKTKPTIYVLGNHEFYGGTYPKLINTLKEQSIGTNVRVLENDVFKVGDVNFFGCTLWTDFELFGNPRLSGYQCQQEMNDYKKIKRLPGYSKLRSIDTALINTKSQIWMKEQLELHRSQKNVVITHHGPSIMSAPEHYRNDVVTSAYVSNFEGLIKSYEPCLWLHGHLHNTSDYSVNGCRVVCNPKGYPGGLNPDFNSTLIIEI